MVSTFSAREVSVQLQVMFGYVGVGLCRNNSDHLGVGGGRGNIGAEALPTREMMRMMDVRAMELTLMQG